MYGATAIPAGEVGKKPSFSQSLVDSRFSAHLRSCGQMFFAMASPNFASRSV